MILSVIKSLEKCVHDLSLNLESYVKNPGKDFSRSRLLTFDKMIWTFLQMGGKESIKRTSGPWTSSFKFSLFSEKIPY